MINNVLPLTGQQLWSIVGLLVQKCVERSVGKCWFDKTESKQILLKSAWALVFVHSSALFLWFGAFTSPLTSLKCATAWNVHHLNLKVVQLRGYKVTRWQFFTVSPLQWKRQSPRLQWVSYLRRTPRCVCVSAWQSWHSAMKVDVDFRD